jgi:hypothetical protein
MNLIRHHPIGAFLLATYTLVAERDEDLRG